MKTNLCGLFYFFSIFGFSFGHADAQGLPSRSTEKIGDGVYAAIGYISNNMGFIVTDEGVAVIDTGTSPKIGEAFRASIRKITAKPIKYVIYTHYHYDHVFGASALKEKDTIFIAHENTVENLNNLTKLERLNQQSLGSVIEAPVVYPDRTYKDNLTLNFGGKTIRLIHIEAETDDATLVYLPDDKILFIGDMTNNNLGSPLLPEGYPEGLIEAVNLVETLEVDTFVPGHGYLENTNKRTLRAVREVTEFLMKEVKDKVDDGLNLEETQAAVKMPEEFKDDKLLSETFLNSREQYVNRLHKRYTGYYGNDPIKFSPAPSRERNELLAEITGGEKKLLGVAEELIEQERYQLALEMLDIVTTNEPLNKRAHALKGKAFLGLARMTKHNWHAMVVYMNSAKKEKKLASEE